MTDPRILEKYNTLPLPKLRELFDDINELYDYIVDRLHAEGKKEQALERRRHFDQQKQFQQLFIQMREAKQKSSTVAST